MFYNFSNARKETIKSNFLNEFKRGRKAAETAQNVNDVFEKDTVNERGVQRWFVRFRSGDESLEDEEHDSRSSEVDDDQLKTLIEVDPRKPTRELAKELHVDHATVVQHLRNFVKVKSLTSGFRMN